MAGVARKAKDNVAVLSPSQARSRATTGRPPEPVDEDAIQIRRRQERMKRKQKRADIVELEEDDAEGEIILQEKRREKRLKKKQRPQRPILWSSDLSIPEELDADDSDMGEDED